MFLRNGLTSKLSVKRHSTSVYYFAWMPLSLWDKITTFSGLSAPEERKWSQCLPCSESHPCPEPWTASQMPPTCLQTASAGRPSPVLSSWQSQIYLEGCSPAMQEAMAKALACGQEASIVLRPLLADSKDTSRKSSEKLQGWQLWRHWPKVGGHLIMKAKNNVLLSLNSPFPVV